MALFRYILWFVLAKDFPMTSPALLPPGSEEVENFNAIKSATIDEVLLKELSTNKCRFRLREKSLRNLYFHLDDSRKSLYIENSRIKGPTCLKATNVTNDVFASRMDVSLLFPVLTVSGGVRVEENYQSISLGSYRRRYSFSIRIRNFTGSGICFTKWTEIRYEVAECDIRYDKQSAVRTTEVWISEDFPVEEEVFGSASVGRLWRSLTHTLNGNVADGFNVLFDRLDLMKYLRDTRMFDKYKNYVIQSTRNANEFVDNVLVAVRKTIREQHHDRFAIPNIRESFVKKGLLMAWRGSFTADHGTVRGLSTVTRVGDTAFASDNSHQTHFFGSLSFEELDLHYDRWRVEFMNVGPSGTLSTKLRPIRLHIHPYVNFNSGKIYLEDFEIDYVGELAVEVSGLGTALNWVVSKITTWTVGLTRDKVLDMLQKKYDAYIKSILSGYSVDDIMNGRAFGLV